jgi:hypothetical protein
LFCGIQNLAAKLKLYLNFEEFAVCRRDPIMRHSAASLQSFCIAA